MKSYGVLKGKVVDFKRDADDDPHSELRVEVDDTSFRIAVNVRSSRGPQHKRLVEYLILHDLKHPIVDQARNLPPGWNDLTDGTQDGAAIDYIRSNMFRATDMKPIAHLTPGPNNDLFEHLEDFVQRAIDQDDAVLYAFGERWGPEQDKEDNFFHFRPGNGVHLIHMNQGGTGENNGTFRDGALIIDFPGAGTASALFIKFQNQVWHTEEHNAEPIDGAPAVPEIPIPDVGPVAPWPVVAADSPYHLARIIAAIVNPRADDPGRESVTLLNISDHRLNLTDWKILDRNDKSTSLSGEIEPGEAIVIRLDGQGAQLSNKGGTITLLNDKGLKVDGVAYTEEAAKAEGRPIVF